MHGREFVAKELYYGSDGESVFVRLVLDQPGRGTLAGTEIRMAIEGPARTLQLSAMLTSAGVVLTGTGGESGLVKPAYGRFFELSCRAGEAGFDMEAPLRLQLSLWRDGLPLDALPSQGWIEFVPAVPAD